MPTYSTPVVVKKHSVKHCNGKNNRLQTLYEERKSVGPLMDINKTVGFWFKSACSTEQFATCQQSITEHFSASISFRAAVVLLSFWHHSTTHLTTKGVKIAHVLLISTFVRQSQQSQVIRRMAVTRRACNSGKCDWTAYEEE